MQPLIEMKRFVLTILLILTATFSINAGGWIQKWKAGYFQFSQRVTRSGFWYNELHKKTSIRTVSNYTSSVYAEYGFTKKLTGVLYAPLFVRNTLNATRGKFSRDIIQEGDEYNGIGDINVGAKYGLITEGSTVLNVGVTLGLPVGNNSHESLLFTGDGEFNQMLKVEAGQSLGAVYMAAGVGFNNRTRGFSDEFRYEYEIGWTYKKFLIIAKVAGIESFFNGEPGAGGDNTGLFANNLEYLNLGGELVYNVRKNWGISGGVSVPVTGHKVLAAPVLGLSVFYKKGGG